MSAFELIRLEAARSPQERKARLSVRRLCGLLSVSTSGYYDWRAREGAGSASMTPPDERLIVKIRAIQEETDWTCGSRRVREELRNLGEEVGRRKIRRILRESELHPVQRKRFKKTTNSEHTLGYSPNLLKQEFRTSRLNEVWVSDITYIWTGQGWSYLAVVLDLYSRRVVGWSHDANMSADLPTRALERAIALRCPPEGAIIHSDRGSQYASEASRNLLRQHRLRQSMSGTGNCYDNAVAESFFVSLKKERISRHSFVTRTESFDAVQQ